MCLQPVVERLAGDGDVEPGDLVADLDVLQDAQAARPAMVWLFIRFSTAVPSSWPWQLAVPSAISAPASFCIHSRACGSPARREGAHRLAVHRRLAEVERHVALLPPVLAVELQHQRRELVHVDRAGDRAAPEAQLRGGGVVVDRALRLGGGIAGYAQCAGDVGGFGGKAHDGLLLAPATLADALRTLCADHRPASGAEQSQPWLSRGLPLARASCAVIASLPMSARFVAAIDQGTTSSRCMLFDAAGAIVAVAQKEHRQIFPRPGWVEHDAEEIWANVRGGGRRRAGQGRRRAPPTSPRSASPTSARRRWSGTRPPASRSPTPSSGRTPAPTGWSRELGGEVGQDRFRDACGLPLATYFSGPKIRWLLDKTPGARAAAERGELLFGTMDAWLIWKLTGRHVTDVTNASRTMLMNLKTLDWDDDLLDAIGVPRAMLPRDPAVVRGLRRRRAGVLEGVPVAAALGDQQAALFGQTCFSPGEGKCTYGTGSFLLVNTGERPVASKNGLLTTRRLPDRPASRRSTRWRARSRSPARWCSGCATTSA